MIITAREEKENYSLLRLRMHALFTAQVPTLAALLQHEDPGVRSRAAQVLGALCRVGGQSGPAAAPDEGGEGEEDDAQGLLPG